MSKKVVIISSTPRVGGNSEVLCEAFMEGCISVGNDVELIRLRDYKINYCIACYKCKKSHKCFQDDGMNEILEKIINSDVVVFATPIYYYDVCGQLKVFIDRLLPRYSEIKNKDMYFITSLADNDKDMVNSSIQTINGFIECVDNVNLKGIIYGTGLYELERAKESIHYIEAYDMGACI